MYKALVRSHLDYCDTIYHIPASNSQINLGVTLNSLMEKVERTEYQAALAITGTWQGTNRSKFYEELGWETLPDRRWCRRILQIHKIEKYKTPSYLRDIPTFTSLKSRPLSLIRPKIKSNFGIHDALGLRYLFQLRVNLSPLRSHKMRHNFSDTPSETCECNSESDPSS